MVRDHKLSSIIRLNLSLASVVSILLTALFLLFVVNQGFEENFSNNIKGEARVIADLLEAGGDLSRYNDIPIRKGSNRITLVNKEGRVLFDSMADAITLENHMDRPEVKDAFLYGEAGSVRNSETLGVKYYYHAVRLKGGEAVLRVSAAANTSNTILLDRLWNVLFILCVIILLVNRLSAKLTANIVKPFEEVDLDTLGNEPSIYQDIYQELTPFLKKISQQKKQLAQSMSELEKRATTIETITENMREGLLMIDKEGAVISVNNGFRKIIGNSTPIQLPQKLIFLTRQVALRKAAEMVQQGFSYSDVLELEGKYYQIMGGPVEGGGGILLLSDITEREKAARRRREFSANVSHELRTPLTSISGYGELLQLGFVKEEDVSEFGHKIHSEALRLLGLIENIMKLSSLDESDGEEKRDFIESSLSKLADETVRRLELTAKEAQVTLHTQCEEATVVGNQDMLADMLYNLAENAIKYNKAGGGVTIRTERLDGAARFSVSDTGVGIPSKDIKRIFERFYRVDKARSSKTGGNGLGLSIVKHIADYHDATISVQSELGKGTTISVTFPKR